MSFGLQVTSTLGTVQLDADYSNYALLQEGSITLQGGEGTISFPQQASPPLVFVKNTSGTAFVGMPGVSTSQASFYAVVNKEQFTTVTVQYRIYARSVSGTPSGQMGLIVYNASGAVVSDSRKRYLPLAAVTSLPSSYSIGYVNGGVTDPFVCMNPTGLPGTILDETKWFIFGFRSTGATVYMSDVYWGITTDSSTRQEVNIPVITILR